MSDPAENGEFLAVGKPLLSAEDCNWQHLIAALIKLIVPAHRAFWILWSP
jgi:hypothetical protein